MVNVLTLSMDKRTSPSPIMGGEVFGRLVATDEFELRIRPDGRNRCYQKFECSCGTVSWLVPYSVKSGNTSSCGCLHKEQLSDLMTTHGLSKTSKYRVKLNKARRSQKRASSVTDEVEKLSFSTFDCILLEFNNQCWICEVELDVVQWDHVHPLSKGGAHVRSNLRPACKDCNGRKGSIHPFTEGMRIKIATAVRVSRTPQEHTIPVTDG